MKSIRLLMVDDDLEDQELFGQAVKEAGIVAHIEFASNGVEALEKIKTGKLPDIIFCDINMPIMNGMQLLEEIKKSHEWSLIPMVMYTTSSSELHKSQCKRMGAAHYIVKPSCFSKMCQEISNSFKLIFDLTFLQDSIPLMDYGK